MDFSEALSNRIREESQKLETFFPRMTGCRVVVDAPHRHHKYRFRLLNGSTSRTYTLGLSTGGFFHQIGTDVSLLPAPVPLTQVTVMPGERADVVMDFAERRLAARFFGEPPDRLLPKTTMR